MIEHLPFVVLCLMLMWVVRRLRRMIDALRFRIELAETEFTHPVRRWAIMTERHRLLDRYWAGEAAE
jgi:hypothetical protein